ncbi:conserved unknown protein [Ectocarpus siliculosus]|uniref:Peptidase S54 rhomboid domain-containing protein n=1 Tax=Ectocarpus siliculosus TaxID=2880 RepID=D7G3N4_ECTSI|nr:conserved unknown protein [Ectocarpus siliculosus]|eukprot:CBJ33566.1 conserved unknown protein [Ectocarpus siliculosus]
MAISSLSRRQRVTALLGASAVAILSWAYFVEVWKGVVVRGGGDTDANGYYKWEPTQKSYIKSAQAPAGAWRVPNVYDLVSRGPQFRKDAGPLYFLKAIDKQQQSRVWFVMRSGEPEYRSPNALSVLDNTPPTTGWAVGSPQKDAGDGLGPPPEVHVCGKRVAPDADPAEQWKRGGGGRRGKSPFELGRGPAEIVSYPGTVLLLVINLAFAYHLWANRVSPDAVAISYARFWEEREYWRLFTASFSHFEPLHLVFNAMGTWNTRELERLLGTFRYLYLSLDLVVTTIMVVMVIKHALVKWRGVESQREGKAVGFSCVLFAYMTYLAVAMREFCPIGTLCFSTYSIPMFWGMPSLPVNLGPFASQAIAQVVMPRAAFLGHLSGIFMGYLMAWGFLGGLSIPILAGISVIFMLQHSKAWARRMPDFSLLLQSWAGGDAGRVARARRMGYAFAAHVCLTVALSMVFSWGSTVGEVMALVVGFNALQALKCCCCPDSVPAEHRFCVNLLKAYGALSAILLVSDLLSFGAILGQSCFVTWSGVSDTSRHYGLALLLVAAAVHGLAVAACIEGGVIFRDGQTFLSTIGLKQVVTAYSFGANSGGNTTAAAITSGRLYRGGGRSTGTAASNRTGSTISRGNGGTQASGARLNRSPPAGRAGGGDVGLPLLGREGEGGNALGEIEL